MAFIYFSEFEELKDVKATVAVSFRTFDTLLANIQARWSCQPEDWRESAEGKAIKEWLDALGDAHESLECARIDLSNLLDPKLYGPTERFMGCVSN